MKRLPIIAMLLLLPLVFAIPVPADAADFQVTWTASVSADVVGYRVFMRFESAPYDYTVPLWEGPGIITSVFGDTDMADGNYYFVARAFDAAGNESGDSNEAMRPVDHTAPAAPSGCQTVEILPSP